MDATPAAILVACLLFCTGISCDATAGGGCSLSSIVVTQTGTGEWAHGQPVYAVAVRNTCGCAQSDVKLACAAFEGTLLAVDAAKFKPAGGGLCLVNGGGPVVQGLDVAFSYALSNKVSFRPVSSTLEC